MNPPNPNVFEFEHMHEDVVALLEGLADIADEYDTVVMIYRSHGQVCITMAEEVIDPTTDEDNDDDTE